MPNNSKITCMVIQNLKNVLIFLILMVLAETISAQTKCDFCEKMITGRYVTSDGKSYHSQCYADHIQPHCDYCKKSISGAYTILDDNQYHPDCYINHIVAKCDICRHPLEDKYLVDYWGNAYHESHTQKLHECSTCGRLVCDRLTRGGYTLGDGRVFCNLCNATAVTDDYAVSSSLRFVKQLFTLQGIHDFPNNIPITLVDKPTLKRLSETYSDEMQGFTDQRAQTLNGQVISRESHIYILSHLPLIVFQSVLAHELLHVYLFENDLRLKSNIREGFCNLGSEMVYKSTNSKFSTFRLENMQESQHPDYGVGYRKMSGLLHKQGWSYVLRNLERIR